MEIVFGWFVAYSIAIGLTRGTVDVPDPDFGQLG